MKKCKYCKKEILENNKECPYCGRKVKKSRKGIVLFLFIVLFVFIGVVLYQYFTSDWTRIKHAEPQDFQEGKVYELGDTVKMDNLQISLISVKKMYPKKYTITIPTDKGDQTFSFSLEEPDEGFSNYSFVFKIENISTEDIFVCYSTECFADDYEMDENFLLDSGFLGTSLNAGRKVQYTVGYKIKNGARDIEIEFSPSYSETVVFHVKKWGFL